MSRKIIAVVMGAMVIFLFTNILFPELFQNTIFAEIARTLQLADDDQLNIHFLIETQQPSDKPQNIAFIEQILDQQKFAFDQNHNLVQGAKLKEAKAKEKLKTIPATFYAFDQTKTRRGDRVVKAKILPRNEYNKFPIDLKIYTVNSDKKLSPLTNPTRYFLKAQSDYQKSARLIAEFIVNACIF
jgi:hypothetical protein